MVAISNFRVLISRQVELASTMNKKSETTSQEWLSMAAFGKRKQKTRELQLLINQETTAFIASTAYR